MNPMDVTISLDGQASDYPFDAHEAEFVTVPVESDDVWMIGERLITEDEFAQLQIACDWNENRLTSNEGLPKKGGNSLSD